MLSTTQNQESLSTLTADPLLLKIVKEWLPESPMSQIIPIAREAARLRERLSSTPFYAKRAQEEGESYWVRRSISYQGTD